MADTPRPFDAYRGTDDYVFVSYAHADSETVYPDLTFLREAGFNIWYDAGISPGSRWTSELADAIENCTLFITFLSPAAVASENCTNEIEFAISRKRPLLVIHTEQTDVPAGLELSLGGRQALLRADLDPASYQSQLADAARKLMAGNDPFDPRTAPRTTPRSSSGTETAGQKRPMLIAAGIVLLAGLVYLSSVFVGTPADSDLRLAIAVRPFETTGSDENGRLFADGVADDLIIRLGRWRTLPVIARSASFDASLPADPTEVGKRLNVRYLVEGQVQSVDDNVNISVYLVDAADGRNVWSRTYQRRPDDALSVQTDVIDAIVSQINPALINAETQRAVRADPTNLDAWSAAMRGWWHLNTETREGLEEAQNWFLQAAELDPAWSWPHSALALTRYRAIINGWSADPRASVGQLIQSANKAVQLDANDAFAHHALGHAYALQGQVETSLDALARGVELAPNDPMANGCYAMQLAASARSAEALLVMDHVMALSPEDPWQHRFALVRARAHFAAADYSDSEQWALRSLQLRPNQGAFLHSVAAPALGDGLERALERTAQALAQKPLPPVAMIEQSFRRTTEAGYVDRLLEGLKMAGFE